MSARRYTEDHEWVLLDGDTVLDRESNPLGFRWFEFDPGKGFSLKFTNAITVTPRNSITSGRGRSSGTLIAGCRDTAPGSRKLAE